MEFKGQGPEMVNVEELCWCVRPYPKNVHQPWPLALKYLGEPTPSGGRSHGSAVLTTAESLPSRAAPHKCRAALFVRMMAGRSPEEPTVGSAPFAGATHSGDLPSFRMCGVEVLLAEEVEAALFRTGLVERKLIGWVLGAG